MCCANIDNPMEPDILEVQYCSDCDRYYDDYEKVWKDSELRPEVEKIYKPCPECEV